MPDLLADEASVVLAEIELMEIARDEVYKDMASRLPRDGSTVFDLTRELLLHQTQDQ